MTNKTFLKKLYALDACESSILWLGKRDLETAWNECENVGWMLWLADKSDVDRKLLSTCALEFAERVLPIYEKLYPKDTRVRDCLKTLAKWIKGNASNEELVAAWGAWAAAWAAAEAAAWAARVAAEAAAEAAAGVAAGAAAGSASAEENKKQLQIIRKTIPLELIESVLRKIK